MFLTHCDSTDANRLLLQDLPTQSVQPSLLRGQTSSEAEEQFLQAFQHADPDNAGSVSRQVSTKDGTLAHASCLVALSSCKSVRKQYL